MNFQHVLMCTIVLDLLCWKRVFNTLKNDMSVSSIVEFMREKDSFFDKESCFRGIEDFAVVAKVLRYQCTCTKTQSTGLSLRVEKPEVAEMQLFVF